MLITKTSEITGVEHSLELPTVTEERLAKCWRYGGTEHIQDVFPELSSDEREFLMTGVTAEEWEEIFGVDEE